MNQSFYDYYHTWLLSQCQSLVKEVYINISDFWDISSSYFCHFFGKEYLLDD